MIPCIAQCSQLRRCTKLRGKCGGPGSLNDFVLFGEFAQFGILQEETDSKGFPLTFPSFELQL